MRSISKVISSYRERKAFAEVEAYCMFIGYPRSGHSLIGSLLDAHPDAVIAHEFDALSHLNSGTTREELFRLLLENSREFTASGRMWNDYTYRVPNQWQGRFRKLRLIGDKKGGGSSKALGKSPALLGELLEVVRADVKLVHVVRNPFDTIATMANNSRRRSLEEVIEWYFSLCEVNARVRTEVPELIFDLKHEDFIADPVGHLGELCGFLGLSHESDYLRDCASIAHPSPHESRHSIDWPPQSLERIQQGISRYNFLSTYSFDNR